MEPGDEMSGARFSSEAVTSLGGPVWLAEHRQGAWERFDGLALPSESEEIWRYSGIDAFELDRFGPSAKPGESLGGSVADMSARVAGRLGEISVMAVTVDGSLATLARGGSASPEEVIVHSASGLSERPEKLGSVASPHDAFGALAESLLPDVLRIAVTPKAEVELPIVVVHVVTGEPAGPWQSSAFPRTLVEAGEGASASVVEIVVSLDSEAPSLVVPVTEVDLADGARLAYASVQSLNGTTWQVATQASRIGRDAELRSFAVGLGGRYARLRTDADVVGERGSSQLFAAYLGTGSQVHDLRTLQDHHAARSRSDLLFQGALSGEARSVYSGLIRIARGAHGSDAFQTNRNLVLSDGAHADSVPNLDIAENDVRCSHASTVGPIDPEQLYYLESRGIRPEVGERLVVSGFFADIASRSPVASIGRWLEQEVGERLRLDVTGGSTIVEDERG